MYKHNRDDNDIDNNHDEYHDMETKAKRRQLLDSSSLSSTIKFISDRFSKFPLCRLTIMACFPIDRDHHHGEPLLPNLARSFYFHILLSFC